MKLLSTLLKTLLAIFAMLMLYDSFMPPISTLMVARALTLRPVSRQWVPLARVAPSLTRAIITAEDGKFCMHHGVDWKSLHRAVEKAVDDDSDSSHGASTVTMQVAKNLFLWHGRSYLRKGLEIPMALLIDAIWSKRHIMEIYVNVAEFGDGIFGAEAAARHYFHKSASALTPREAALLAAILPNPIRRNAASPSAYVSGYANSISARAIGEGAYSSCLKR